MRFPRSSCACSLTLRTFQSEDQDVRKFSPITPPWPPTPSFPHPLTVPSSPVPWQSSLPLQLLPISSPPPPPSSPPPPSISPPIRTILKRERAGDNGASNQPPSKQQRISQFFTKLTRVEGMDQATKHLIQSADAREEWAKKQEAEKRVKKASQQAANTSSQQRFRERKKESEIQSGTRGPDGKTKKVTESTNSRTPVKH